MAKDSRTPEIPISFVSPSRYLQEENYRQTRRPLNYARTIDPGAYRDPQFFPLERERVFQRYWVPVAMQAELPKAGDVKVAEVAGKSLLVVRDADGGLNAFQNSCRHRGTQLCEKSGNVGPYLRCPYHGWGYDLKGACVGTPLFREGEVDESAEKAFDLTHLEEAFNRGDYGLLKVRVDTWGPAVFVCFDPSAPSLQEQLGDLAFKLDNHRMERWQVISRRDYEIDCNWKLLVENAIEYYHLPWVHPALVKSSRMEDHCRWQGPGMYSGIRTTPVTSTESSSWLGLEPVASLSEEERITGYFFIVFPNLIFFLMPSHAFVLFAEPQQQGRTIERTYLISAPETTAGASAESISGLRDWWHNVNMEDIGIVERVQKGLSSSDFPGGPLCYRFEEPVLRHQNMIIDALVGIRRVPPGDEEDGGAAAASV